MSVFDLNEFFSDASSEGEDYWLRYFNNYS